MSSIVLILKKYPVRTVSLKEICVNVTYQISPLKLSFFSIRRFTIKTYKTFHNNWSCSSIQLVRGRHSKRNMRHQQDFKDTTCNMEIKHPHNITVKIKSLHQNKRIEPYN